MRARNDLLVWMARLLAARDIDTAQGAMKHLGEAAQGFVDAVQSGSVEPPARIEPFNHLVPPNYDFPVSHLNDVQLNQLNSLLPWAAMTVDGQGRVLGAPYTDQKRSKPTGLTEKRHRAFHAVLPFTGKHVLEVGCFEGIHTIGSAILGAKVTAVDGRVENILKTMARLWAYGFTANPVLWNLEETPPSFLPADWDILHHIGVLYHLTDPVGHLMQVLPRTRNGVLLDTHVADDQRSATHEYTVAGKAYRYFHYGEKTASPFAGMLDHAKWLTLEDLVAVISSQGFGDVRVVSDRAERNGRRVTIWGFR